jgi:hypothetical protein
MDTTSVVELLRTAIAAVREADVPPELHAAAFGKAIELLGSSKKGTPPTAGRPEESRIIGQSSDADSEMDKVANALNIDAETLAEVYEFESDKLNVVVPASRLESSKKGATRQLALLLAAGRQAGGREEWTDVKEIRQVCDDFGKFDSANFAFTITSMGDVFSIKGTGQQRKVRVNRTGLELAASLIRGLTGGER